MDVSTVQKAFNRSRHNSTDLGLKFPKSLLGKLCRLTALHRRSFYRSRKIDSLIGRRFFDMLNHKNIHWSFLSFELKTKLLLER